MTNIRRKFVSTTEMMNRDVNNYKNIQHIKNNANRSYIAIYIRANRLPYPFTENEHPVPEKTNTLDFWIIVFSGSGGAILLFVVGLSCLVWGGKSPIGILNKVGPFQEILKIVTNLFIFDRSCQKTITLLVSYKR